MYPAVSPLEPKDRFALESAGGWLMLGNVSEALQELAQLSPEALTHPDALILSWDCYAQAKRWPEAIAVADQLITAAPSLSEGYVKRAYALHELKRTQEAWDTLHPLSKRFRDNWLIPYNLACYACQLGRPGEALKLFERALRLGDTREIRSMGLADPDLQPLKDRIKELPVSSQGLA